jgi:hypothetical protein
MLRLPTLPLLQPPSWLQLFASNFVQVPLSYSYVDVLPVLVEPVAGHVVPVAPVQPT